MEKIHIGKLYYIVTNEIEIRTEEGHVTQQDFLNDMTLPQGGKSISGRGNGTNKKGQRWDARHAPGRQSVGQSWSLDK